MGRNGGLAAAFLAVLALLGVSNFSRTSGSPPTAESKQSASGAGGAPEPKVEPSSSCLEIESRLRRFTDETSEAPIKTWGLPDSCYQDEKGPQPPSAVMADHTPVQALSDVKFAVATLPNPVSTHLPLLFDRIVESIQQAAKDDLYSYDASWFPWDADRKDYSAFPDQQAAEELRKIHESQPGLMVFRRSQEGVDPYAAGLVVFVVGEQPTGGINDQQFQNAIEWIKKLGGFRGTGSLRILGPTFSGSIPSLERDLDRGLHRVGRILRVEVSSGTVSSFTSYHDFTRWLDGLQNESHFRTAMENDSLVVDRFCRYLQIQGYGVDHIAFLSEDETAFGGGERRDSKQGCSGAIRLYYPRDIATLRSAYESQSILTPPKSQSSTNAPSTTLRGDLSEPANGEHDSVRRFGGQLNPLALESILLDITSRLREKRIEFIIVRSTSSLDQIFLSEFLHRAYPGGRVVIDGADLLFSRGAEGSSLHGVMLLSTYPLLTSEQDWTASFLKPRNTSYRTFGEDASEGAYIVARDLFGDSGANVPIHDYGPPAWALDPVDPKNPPEEIQRPATWLTVVGHRQFWPLAVLHGSPQGGPASILDLASTRGDRPQYDDGERRPLRIPTSMWMALIACVLWSSVHAYFCWSGCIMGSPRARAYFAPLPWPQHPALIALGSLLVAMVPVTVAACSGLFSWSFEQPWAGVLLENSLRLGFALPVFACMCNSALPPLRASTAPEDNLRLWRLLAGLTAVFCLELFILNRIDLFSKLTAENRIPVYLRSVNLSSGVSPLLPQLLLLAGGYLWFWCTLRGLAHFGHDRPLLPKEKDLPMMPMFSRERVGDGVEDAARPVTRGYLARLLTAFFVSVILCAVALQGFSMRTLGDLAFGRLIFYWVCLYIAIIFADGLEMWRAWSAHRQLLIYLDRLPLRRTLRALKGLAWGSIWKLSGNVLEERYRVISLQLESRRHLENAAQQWKPGTLEEVFQKAELLGRLERCRLKSEEFAQWYVAAWQARRKVNPVDLTQLQDFQEELASTAAMAMQCILIPAWKDETVSLIFDRSEPDEKSEPEQKKSDEEDNTSAVSNEIPLHVRAAEEFFVLPYVAFIQNILGRIRTIALGSLWLFVAATLAMSSYPFEPLNVLGGIFLAVFSIYGGVSILIYAQMSRDATLSHITDTRPGELGWDFWGRLVTFGAGPLIGLLTTLFPSMTDFVFSWLQPGTQALK